MLSHAPLPTLEIFLHILDFVIVHESYVFLFFLLKPLMRLFISVFIYIQCHFYVYKTSSLSNPLTPRPPLSTTFTLLHEPVDILLVHEQSKLIGVFAFSASSDEHSSPQPCVAYHLTFI